MQTKLQELIIDDTFYETEVPEGYPDRRFQGIPDPCEARAIISGAIVKVNVRKGQRVSTGQVILVLEAMKMLIEVEAEIDGRIEEINVSIGDSVRKDQLLARIVD
ncbi:MAG: acetyl-CoA carboxylase biotin carboxyl carrier protein subunit [Deltaproteobacteria bacterium]|nr:acetyl-CoA carboxylase biotin carboxyl carrier protein subunit [Deltaproteobacteria bacterium]